MAWNMITFSQGANEISILLRDVIGYRGPGTLGGTWWNCDSSKYFALYGSEEKGYLWWSIGQFIEIGGWYNDEIASAARIWPASKDKLTGQISVALATGVGHVFFYPDERRHSVYIFDVKKATTWSAKRFGHEKFEFGKCP